VAQSNGSITDAANSRRPSRLRLFGSQLVAASRVAFPTLWLRHFVGSATDIFTYTPSRERLLLYEEARLSLKLERFLEIGSHLGASAVVLAEVLKRHGSDPDRRVFCIDTWLNDAMSAGRRETRTEFDQNTARWAPFIAAVAGDSKVVPIPFQGKCDLVFIDGDHSYEGARADAGRFAPLVRAGGRLLMHDHDRVSVARVAGELLASGQWIVSRSVGHLLSMTRQED